MNKASFQRKLDKEFGVVVIEFLKSGAGIDAYEVVVVIVSETSVVWVWSKTGIKVFTDSMSCSLSPSTRCKSVSID